MDERRKKAAQTLDEMLTIYDDDEEAWFARGAMLGGFQGGPNEGIPYYKALLRVNPLHPGANHELVHFYEGSQRPALGWPYAVGYMASSPGHPARLPHAGPPGDADRQVGATTDWSSKAMELYAFSVLLSSARTDSAGIEFDDGIAALQVGAGTLKQLEHPGILRTGQHPFDLWRHRPGRHDHSLDRTGCSGRRADRRAAHGGPQPAREPGDEHANDDDRDDDLGNCRRRSGE